MFQECLQGYPMHRWLAIGHLAEAETEAQQACPDFAARLRSERIKAQRNDYCRDCVALLDMCHSLGEMYGGPCQNIRGKNMNVAKELIKVARLLVGEIPMDKSAVREIVEEVLNSGDLPMPVVRAQFWVETFGDEYDGLTGFTTWDVDLWFDKDKSISLNTFVKEFFYWSDDYMDAFPEDATYNNVLRDRKLMKLIIDTIDGWEFPAQNFKVNVRAGDSDLTDDKIFKSRITVGDDLEDDLDRYYGIMLTLRVKGNKIVWDEDALRKYEKKLDGMSRGNQR